jgi:hypothetical protein
MFNYIGIDVSKATLQVYTLRGHLVFPSKMRISVSIIRKKL